MKVYLTNGHVAWEIPEESAYAYSHKYYVPCPGWDIFSADPSKDIYTHILEITNEYGYWTQERCGMFILHEEQFKERE